MSKCHIVQNLIPRLISFVEKNNIFLRFCLCIFESDTVKRDCPMQENYEIFKDVIQTVGLLLNSIFYVFHINFRR